MVFMPPAASLVLTDDGDKSGPRGSWADSWPVHTRDLILPLLGALEIPRRASREGAMVFGQKPKVFHY